MKANLSVFLLFLFPALLNAQNGFRPILDPTALCNQQIKPKAHILNPMYEDKEEPHTQYEILYVVEEMPAPEISLSEIEKILVREIAFNSQEKEYSTTLSFQCIVNCKGEAGDFQINQCPEEFANVGSQMMNVLGAEFNNWKPGVQRDKNVDVLIGIKVEVIEGKIKVDAPVLSL